jgi:hypothetical protein
MFNIKFNSRSTSPTTHESIDLAKNFEYAYDDLDSKIMNVQANKANEYLVKLIRNVNGLKATEIKVKNIVVSEDIHYFTQIMECSYTKKKCNGHCTARFDPLDLVFNKLALTKEKDYDSYLDFNDSYIEQTLLPYAHKVIIEISDTDIKFCRNSLINFYLKYNELSSLICDKFNGEFIVSQLKNLPDVIIMKKDFTDSDVFNKSSTSISDELLNKIASTISNEVEARIIKILIKNNVIKNPDH